MVAKYSQLGNLCEKWAVRSPSLHILIPLNSVLVTEDFEFIGNWASPLVIVLKISLIFIGLILGIPWMVE